MFILTLITNPNKLKLDEQIINKALMAIERKKGNIDNFSFLATDTACDIYFSNIEQNLAEQNLTTKLAGIEVDFVIQPNSNNRKKKLLVSDMDSTIINQECIDEIAAKLNLKEKVSAITERTMNGEIDFESALLERVSLLKGISAEDLFSVYKQNISLMEGARELVQTMKKHGSYCLLVSGGFTFFTEKIARDVGFNNHYANILELANNNLTGNVIKPILGKEAKLEILNKTAEELNLTKQQVLAVGDGANDLPMLQDAGLGVAYHAKPKVQQQTKAKINYTNLKSLLYIQGYKEIEITNG